MPDYRTAPVTSPGMPARIPFIVINEAAGRCSCYGMRVILVVFMARLAARGAVSDCVRS